MRARLLLPHQRPSAEMRASRFHVLVASFFGWLFFDEILLIDDYIGALLIIGTGVALILMTPQDTSTES